MSDKALIPAPHVLYAGGNSITRYRAAFTCLQVFPLPDDGRRIEVSDDGKRTIFDLSAGQAKHLAGLLTEPIRASAAEGGS